MHIGKEIMKYDFHAPFCVSVTRLRHAGPRPKRPVSVVKNVCKPRKRKSSRPYLRRKKPRNNFCLSVYIMLKGYLIKLPTINVCLVAF